MAAQATNPTCSTLPTNHGFRTRFAKIFQATAAPFKTKFKSRTAAQEIETNCVFATQADTKFVLCVFGI